MWADAARSSAAETKLDPPTKEFLTLLLYCCGEHTEDSERVFGEEDDALIVFAAAMMCCVCACDMRQFVSVICGTSHLTPHTSHLTPHTSHLTPHTSHLTPQTSHLTPHTSHPAMQLQQEQRPHVSPFPARLRRSRKSTSFSTEGGRCRSRW